MTESGDAPSLPAELQDRLSKEDEDVRGIVESAAANIQTKLPSVAFSFTSSAPGDILTTAERAQSVSFIVRYELIPNQVNVQFVERDGSWRIDNFAALGHVLNDFRPLIQNQNDAVYYQNVHNFWLKTLTRTDPTQGMTIIGKDAAENDITPLVRAHLIEHNRALKSFLAKMEYRYLYNGMLQHSDLKYADRFWLDYTSGELNYIVWRHVRPLGFVKDMLYPYYRLMRFLTFPALGPLWPKPPKWVSD